MATSPPCPLIVVTSYLVLCTSIAPCAVARVQGRKPLHSSGAILSRKCDITDFCTNFFDGIFDGSCDEEGAVVEKYRLIEALHLTVFFAGPQYGLVI